ncbi:hypothetical protein [Paraflavitalea speifideaquila]|uniref:hypothetical protein n=1 Tax=Paraflavitalea speifideaquila TaxID=3076558 RepID=UPI0028EA92D5|nr:hypothetical protein [Paraflavitalea speifideiaquila]
MQGILKAYPALHKPDSLQGYDTMLSALLAMMETAKKMQPSGKMINDYEQRFLDSCKKIGFPEEVIDRSLAYGSWVSKKDTCLCQGGRI